MYKKLLYSSVSLPFSYVTAKAFLWQRRRKVEKILEIEARKKSLNNDPLDITPENGDDRYEHNFCSDEEFSEKYAYRPVEITGIYDHSNEILVDRVRDHERGYCMTLIYIPETINTFYYFSN